MKKNLLYIVLLMSLISFGGCGKKGEEKKEVKRKQNKSNIEKIKKATAKSVKEASKSEIEDFKKNIKKEILNKKEILKLTSGKITENTEIAIEFKNNQVEKKFVGKEIKNSDILNFSPELKGDLVWENKKILKFIPKEKLEEGIEYNMILDLVKLFHNEERIFPKTAYTEFEIPKQQVLGFRTSFEQVSKNSNKRVFLQAELKLLKKMSIEDVKKSISISGDKNYKFDISSMDKESFHIKTEEIKRGKNDEEIKIIISKEVLNMKKNYSEKLNLTSSDSLSIIRVEEVMEEHGSGIRLLFSDELKEELDYYGYISVKPYENIDIEVKGKEIFIRGDFQNGLNYNVKLLKGIKSKLGLVLNENKDLNIKINISNIYPKLEFVNSGVYMPSVKNGKIAIRTMNLNRVSLKVKKINKDSYLDFFYNKGVNVKNDWSNKLSYGRYGFKNYGEVVFKDILDLPNEEDKWVVSELDMSKLIGLDKSGVYVLEVKFDQDDAMYFPSWSYWKINDYMYDNSFKIKHIILSDIGLSVKEDKDSIYVFANSILTGEPLSNIMLKYRSNSKIFNAKLSDTNGFAKFDLNKKRSNYYVEAIKGEEYSIISLSESSLESSLFDIGGLDNKGLKVFIYEDRGVYRPGDRINLSTIIRDKNGTFPENHPISLKVYNPRGKTFYEESKSKAVDGFYSFSFTTNESSLTGDWLVVVKVGDKEFEKIIKVEEIVPYKIKVEFENDRKEYSYEELEEPEELSVKIKSKYLFGTPAKKLMSESKFYLECFEKKFKTYSDFTFDNPIYEFESLESNEYIETLDESGEVEINWNLPDYSKIPSDARIKLVSKVIEKSGRPVPNELIIPMEPYKEYIGIRKFKNNQLPTGENAKFEVVLLDKDGKAIQNRKLKYKIYFLNRYWWWEYSSNSEFKKHFKSNNRTELISEGIVKTGVQPATIEYQLAEYGEMFIEIEDADADEDLRSHVAGYFFRSYWWGNGAQGKSADILEISTDKKSYKKGETAKIYAKTPNKGKALITIEKSGEIIYKKWKTLSSEKTIFEVPIKDEYSPNIYANIVVFQPYAEKENDLPVRLYGIIPINVEKANSRLTYEIKKIESIRPESNFRIEISTKEKKASQLTVAIVDEGILNITKFKTPNPWKHFFAKERLMTKSFDIFGDIIGLNTDYIYKIFTVGGGEVEADGKKESSPKKKKRFKPVALFKGPVLTDNEGNASLEFKMSDYVGAVRVMVVGAVGESYGSVEKSVPVKTELMVVPNLPRVIKTGDKITVPVTVFAMEDSIGNVDVTLKIEGDIEAIGKKIQKVSFDKKDSKDVEFELKAGESLGFTKIIVEAKSDKYFSKKEVDLEVKTHNAYTYINKVKVVNKGEKVSFKIPEEGIKNSANLKLSLSSRKPVNMNKRLKYLIRYPYGCIEQTTSSVFPQLYLADIFELSNEEKAKIDKNINAGIERLKKFQNYNGSMSYWPNSDGTSSWGTNYAGHFLIEAKKKGYYVPEAMFNKLMEYQRYQSRYSDGTYMERVYRVYMLAINGDYQNSAMNYLKESAMKHLKVTEKLLLATSYQMSGYEETADKIVKGISDITFETYTTRNLTYGSELRDRAMILEAYTKLKKYDLGLIQYNIIADALSGESWYSTQTTAYSLLAIGKYLKATEKENKKIKGKIKLPGEKDININSDATLCEFEIDNNFGKTIEFKNKSDIPLFIEMNWEGIPVKNEIKSENSKFYLELMWFDEAGNSIDVKNLKQGDTIWGVIKVSKERGEAINECALVQQLPSGWEIENTRLLGSSRPSWMKDIDGAFDREEFIDIRDDRMMWFFDISRYRSNYIFTVKINVVTVGEFFLPPTTVEAMYDNSWKSTVAGKDVKVIKRK